MNKLLRTIAAACALAAAVPSAFSDAPFRQEGIASWYGPEFEGKPTASGEVFDSRLLTAAHPTLPFGTVVLVTNAQNGRSVAVRVNDRGPFVPARIIDVSKAAAERLDMVATGTAPVVVEALSDLAPAAPPAPSAEPLAEALPAAPPAPDSPLPAPVAPVPAAPTPLAAASPSPAPVVQPALPVPADRARARFVPVEPDPASGRVYRLQVGSYRVAANAADAARKLEAVGLAPAYEKAGDFYRIVVVAVPASALPAAAEKLAAAGFLEVLARVER